MPKLKVVAVSTNQNSFGLRNMVMIGDAGTGWSAAANDLSVKPKDTVLAVPDDQDVLTFLTLQSFEIPQKLHPNPPAELMAEVWG